MTDLTPTDGLRQLHECEQRIRDGGKVIVAELVRIRDNGLYKFDGFDTWERYCRERWGYSDEYVRRLITAEEYRAVLPPPPTIVGKKDKSGGQWNEATVREFTRLPKKDAAKVAEKVVKAVEDSHREPRIEPRVEKVVNASKISVQSFRDSPSPSSRRPRWCGSSSTRN
jgi:hypothetical protein